MDPNTLLQHLRAAQPAMLEALEQLVNHESPSTNKQMADILGRLLAERFRKAGAEVTILGSSTHGDHLRALFAPTSLPPGIRPALVLCHYDTVWPVGTLSARPYRLQERKAFGPGIYDMKASLVLTEFALRALAELDLMPPRPIVVLLTSDEEVGSPSSRLLIEEQAHQAEYVLVLEPPTTSGALKTARKGLGRFTIEVEGRAAHAGIEPEKGINAIHELAHQILRLHSLNDPAQGTSVTVGVVRGGTRPNVVPAHAEAEIDVRVWNQAEAQRISDAILNPTLSTPGAIVRAKGGYNRPPMERNDVTGALFERAKDIAASLGLDLQEAAVGGGSDANFTAALSIPTLDGLGAPGDGAHAEHEHILIEALPIRAALLAGLLFRL
jgi:glutamate carboxypeptidase